MADSEDRSGAYACPVCRKPAAINSKVFPFCSDRCRLVDLNKWMEGRYKISRPMHWQDDNSAPPDDAPG